MKLPAIIALEKLAAGQYGVFTDEQARAGDVSKEMLSHHSRRGGSWRRIWPGVYEVVAQPADWRRPIMAGLLWAGPRAVASHRSAALLLGLDGVRPGLVELTGPLGLRRSTLVAYRRPLLLPEDIEMTGPIRHTAAAQTLLDLAAVLDVDHLEMALESALRMKLTTLDAVGAYSERHTKGVRRLRQVLARRPTAAPPTGSELETRFIQLVRRSAVVPEPERQVPVAHRGETIAVLDTAWRPARLFVELDGIESHDRIEALLYDRDRQNTVVSILGWRPLRYTWTDVVHHGPTTLRKVEAAYRTALTT